MIREMKPEEIEACVILIRSSFGTVAEEFGFTEENAPRFTAFATTVERLEWHKNGENRPMFVYETEQGELVGYYSLQHQNENECELNNLCVKPQYRHDGVGLTLFEHAVEQAKQKNYRVLNIGIVEENKRLRDWYERLGAVHAGTKKFDFFPFTCGYMKYDLTAKPMKNK